MKVSILAIVLVLISATGFGQIKNNVFGHLSYKKSNSYAHVIGIAPDSTYSGIRPTALAAYGYSNTGGSTLMAFAGIGYFHVTYHASTSTYYTDYGVSIQIGTGASNGSVSLSNATTVGLFGNFLNGWINVGIGYNFYNKNALPLVGPGVAFH